jgi:hypothetical protein
MTLLIDFDNVLADLDRKVDEMTGLSSAEYIEQFGEEQYWARLRGTSNFFQELEIAGEAERFMKECEYAKPIVIAVSPGSWANVQRAAWVNQRFPGTTILHFEPSALPKVAGHVLVSKNEALRAQWEPEGTFVLYNNLPDTLRQLRDIHAI